MNAQQYIDRFKQTPMWQVMRETVENSPWHREENVAVHTEMCIQQYMERFYDDRSNQQNKIALLSLLFHDTGKPAAEEVLEKKDGSGTYRRYAGHEQDSAVTFTEQWLTDPVLQSFVSVREARQIRFMIEHHLPYGLKDKAKVQALRTAVACTLGEDEETFYDCLRSDAAGRISDDHETKLQNVEDWIVQFQAVPLQKNEFELWRGTCFVLVGPSGSGKSTWVAKHKNASTRMVSLDTYRLAFFYQNSPELAADEHHDVKQDYRDAFEYCTANDAAFRKFTDEKIKDAFHYAKFGGEVDVFVDNTNGSKKTRARYIQAARNIGMKVVAVEFWNTFETLAARQKTREDKEVPYSSLKQQYFAQTCALLGSEVDSVVVVVPEE
jgi:predicted kinase